MVSVSNKGEDRTEQVVVGGAIALALVVAFGLVGHKAGMLDGLFGPPTVATIAAPVLDVIKAQAGGTLPRAQVSGVVASLELSQALEKDLAKALPGTEIKNSVRVDERAKDGKREIIRISVAADALNEAWPRPRFGDVKRLEILWKESKITLRGAVYSDAAHKAFDAGFEKLPVDNRGAVQLRDVLRPAVASADLQTSVSSTLASRVFTFLPDGTIDPANPQNATIATDLAPLLKDLRGLEILVSAGHLDRGIAQKQADSVRGALIAAGADGTGLRPVPAPQNNPISFIVREKE